MSRWQLVNTGKQSSIALIGKAVAKIQQQRGRIDSPFGGIEIQQRFDLRGKRELFLRGRVVQGLDAKKIARQEYCSSLTIKNCEGEHSHEAAHGIRAPFHISQQ